MVLVVDDSRHAREIACDLIEYAGYDVVEAANGREAVHMARAERPDLVLMDINMPVMDGYEADERLADDPRTRDIPVVAVTAHGSARHRARVEESRFVDWLKKPFMPRDLLDVVAERIGPPVPATGN